MKLNKLSFQITKNDHKFDQSLRIELLIDGKPISKLLETKIKSVPYLYFENDLPSYFDYYLNQEVHYLAVCNCGEGSCGSIKCILDKKNDFVTFQKISVGKNKFSNDFKFTRENYEEEINKILEKIREKEKL